MLPRTTSKSSLNISPIGPIWTYSHIKGVQNFAKIRIKPAISELSDPNLTQMLPRTTSRSSLSISPIGPILDVPPYKGGFKILQELGYNQGMKPVEKRVTVTVTIT